MGESLNLGPSFTKHSPLPTEGMQGFAPADWETVVEWGQRYDVRMCDDAKEYLDAVNEIRWSFGVPRFLVREVELILNSKRRPNHYQLPVADEPKPSCGRPRKVAAACT